MKTLLLLTVLILVSCNTNKKYIESSKQIKWQLYEESIKADTLITIYRYENY